MKKHMRIGAASCLDMIDAFKDKVAELDPNYIGSSETIDADSDICPDCGQPADQCECECATDIQANLEVCPECGEYVDMCVCGANCNSACEDDNCEDSECDPVESADFVDDQEYISGDEGIVDEIYIDEMMQNVADATTDPEFDAVCSWIVEDGNLVFTLTGLTNDSIEEYTCPLTDLTGDVGTDIDYIMDAIRNGV